MVIRDVSKQIHTVVKTKVIVSLGVTPCTVIDGYLSTEVHGATS